MIAPPARRRRLRRWLGAGLVLAATTLATVALAAAATIDPIASHVGFVLKTRWGQTLEGRFPDFEGEVHEFADGRRRVRLRLSARSVEIVEHASYTRLTRGGGFFDAAHHPHVDFVSDVYSPELLRTGGDLPGVLTIRGVRHREVFAILPAACEHPARECDVVASGSIRRTDYGMDRWGFALSDKVRFSLRVRVHAAAP